MRMSVTNLAAGTLIFVDSAKVFPGAVRLNGHAAFGVILVVALAVASLIAEHEIAEAYESGRPWHSPAVAFVIAFVMTMALAALGADKSLGDVILLRVLDRESVAIWLVLLSAKILPLALLIAASRERR